MSNFIEVHYYQDSPMLINVKNIVSVNQHRIRVENNNPVWGAAITMCNQAGDDYYVSSETYEQVVEKIKRCTSTMVIT